MRYLTVTGGTILYITVAMAGPGTPMRPDITCDTVQHSDNKWAAICNNGIEDLTIAGIGICTDTAATKPYAAATGI